MFLLISFQSQPCGILNLFISVSKVFLSACNASADFYLLYLDNEQLLSFLYHILGPQGFLHIFYFSCNWTSSTTLKVSQTSHVCETGGKRRSSPRPQYLK